MQKEDGVGSKSTLEWAVEGPLKGMNWWVRENQEKE